MASLLRGGAAFESQARYSPDGKKIIFTRHGHHLLSFLNGLCLFTVIVIIFFVWLYLLTAAYPVSAVQRSVGL